MKNFDNWNSLKKEIDNKEVNVYFKERDIFFVSLGQNIGYEENGKGKNFSRPVVVLSKFNNNVFIGVPLTTAKKEGRFYFNFFFNKRNNSVILSQIKLIDSKRIIAKIGMMPDKDFLSMKRKTGELLKLTDFS